jgi:HEAT repeat protein
MIKLTSRQLLLSFLFVVCGHAEETAPGPYQQQMSALLARLHQEAAHVRARAAESIGFLRAYAAGPALIAALRDPAVEVRRQAVLALAWCGGREAVPPLLAALDDADWVVRQAAHVALTNLTGLEFPYHADAAAERRAEQAQAWRAWWATVPADQPPKEVLELLGGGAGPGGIGVTASTTYKGPPEVLVDGQLGPAYWQTKNVAPPQWCTLDLGRPREISQVIVHQYGPGYCMTEYELATSLDDQMYESVRREKGTTPATLTIDFPPRRVRYVRITSFGAEKRLYPTTFFEVEVHGGEPPGIRAQGPLAWRQERGLRALGALGGTGASEAILAWLGERPTTAAAYRPAVRAALRSLGRLRDEAGFSYLVQLLENPLWARYAADALGDLGDPQAVPALLAAYPRFAKQLDGTDPADVPADDKMGFPSEDRMLETPYWIAYALCRLPLDGAEVLDTLRDLAPRIMANLPGDHDTFILYQPEVGHQLTRYLLERSGRRQEACEHAFALLGQPRRAEPPADSQSWSRFPPHRIASWLPAVCTEPEDLPRLVALLAHPNGWVRLNACKALAWLGDRRASEPLARQLAAAKAEADFGYSGTFKDEEYNDPAPRWREGLLHALGLLRAHQHTDLIVRVLNDERSVLDVRRAAAEALAELGNEQALAALKQAAETHDFFSIRHVARDALRARGIEPASPGRRESQSVSAETTSRTSTAPAGLPSRDPLEAIVFIKGDNDVPNTPQTVEQADRWRQTYVVTDEGPTYRPGDNLYLLRPARPAGQATPLTQFTEGYVADLEVSWDGTDIVFCRRGRQNPWWQIYTMRVDGTGLRQLTDGPYHSIQPVWLPDGRIAFASSRVGTRDEYHGYACTALCMMDRDGTNLRPIATNIGRDNEPAVLPDGRLVFSRLEVFYSRNKTELTLHAAHPDGTQDVVLYGPERRLFWRQLDHGAPDPADGQEAPLTHRVLRPTQPQPMPDGRHIIVATQGGLTLVGPRRDTETLLCPDFKDCAYTTPFPLPDGRVLCSVTHKTPNRKEVDLGIYVFDPHTGQRELVYNDPATADYEARPILARPLPPTTLVEAPGQGYSGRFFCSTVFATQEPEVALRGRLVRLIEGVPQVGRHSTQTNPPEPVWKNHGGTLARVLGTAPLAADGSFYVEVPADRLLHLQVLDSDRRVLGNQLTWIYPRPGETKSCVGCHEHPHTTARGNNPLAAHRPPLDFLPRGDEFVYRAKAWFKGSLPPEIEDRTRTVRAVNLLGR